MRDELLPQLLPNLRRPPAGILALQAHDDSLELGRQPIRLAIGPPAPVGKGLPAAIFVAGEDLVAGLARDPELGAQRRHLLALEQPGDKPESLVHDVTLLPRHAPSCEGAKVSPMRSEYGVTYGSGRTSGSYGSGRTRDKQNGVFGRHTRATTPVTNSPNVTAPLRIG